MRTHIRIHFDKKTNDLNEDNYISCIIDEENNGEVHPITPTVVQPTVPEVHNCEKCSYSSTYKTNVVCAILLIWHSKCGDPLKFE